MLKSVSSVRDALILIQKVTDALTLIQEVTDLYNRGGFINDMKDVLFQIPDALRKDGVKDKDLTSRVMLSVISSIHDPLGLVCPSSWKEEGFFKVCVKLCMAGMK